MYVILLAISRERVIKGCPNFNKPGSFAETNSSIAIDERELGTLLKVLLDQLGGSSCPKYAWLPSCWLFPSFEPEQGQNLSHEN